jgi:hypothetical protein
MRRRLTAVAAIPVLLFLLAAGCSDDNTDTARSSTPSASTSPSSDVSTSPPSTHATSPPTTSPPTSAATTTSEPTPTTTATIAPTTEPGQTENWVAIVQGLENTRTALYEAPDPARASEMCAVNSTCEEQLHAQFTDMVNKGYRVVDSPPMEVVSADVVPNSYEGASVAESIVVSVDVEFRIPQGAAGRVVDAAGNTVFNLEYTPPPGQSYVTRMTLLRDGLSAPWRESLQEMNQ